jgi:hypothetical protein
MRASIKDKEEYAFKVLEKIAEPYYIVASLMAAANIRQKKIFALLDSGAEVTVIIADFT